MKNDPQPISKDAGPPDLAPDLTPKLTSKSAPPHAPSASPTQAAKHSREYIKTWSDLPFFQTTYPDIQRALKAETREILPPAEDRFQAFDLCAPEATRVVILGQDPYPTPGHAHGLAFSAAPDVTPLPRSLGNIYQELENDVGSRPPNADLRPWARQGVLLINTILTIPAHTANGHKQLGWQTLAQQVLTTVSQHRPTAFVLWGAQAQKLEPYILPPPGKTPHLIVKTAHPSPLSARRGFTGSRPFSKINAWLHAQDLPPIRWA